MLWVLSNWIPFIWQNRSGSNFADNYKGKKGGEGKPTFYFAPLLFQNPKHHTSKNLHSFRNFDLNIHVRDEKSELTDEQLQLHIMHFVRRKQRCSTFRHDVPDMVILYIQCHFFAMKCCIEASPAHPNTWWNSYCETALRQTVLFAKINNNFCAEWITWHL